MKLGKINKFVMARIFRDGRSAFTITRNERRTKKGKIFQKWESEIFHGALTHGETLKATASKEKFIMWLISSDGRKSMICRLEKKKGSTGKCEDILTVDPDYEVRPGGIPYYYQKSRIRKKCA